MNLPPLSGRQVGVEVDVQLSAVTTEFPPEYTPATYAQLAAALTAAQEPAVAALKSASPELSVQRTVSAVVTTAGETGRHVTAWNRERSVSETGPETHEATAGCAREDGTHGVRRAEWTRDAGDVAELKGRRAPAAGAGADGAERDAAREGAIEALHRRGAVQGRGGRGGRAARVRAEFGGVGSGVHTRAGQALRRGALGARFGRQQQRGEPESGDTRRHRF